MGAGNAGVIKAYLQTNQNPRQISDAITDRFEKASIKHSDRRRKAAETVFAELQPSDRTDVDPNAQYINQSGNILDTGADIPLPESKSKFPEERVIDLPPEEENKYESVPFLRYKPVQKLLGLAEGGAVPMKEQMSMFEDGGLMDEGGTVDPVSGNDVPPGSTQEEVRDDIPAQLSEGEFVFPADVVRYIGLSNLMRMRQEAKMGLKMMDEMGQMGNSEEATMPDDLPFDINDLDMEDDDEYNTPQEFAVGGMPTPNPNTGVFYNPAPTAPTTGVAAAPTQAASQQFVQPMRPQQAAVPTAPVYTPAEVPTFKGFVGENIPGVEFEYVEYTNEAGNVIKLRKSKTTGELLDPVPEGYSYVDPEATKTKEVVTTPTTPQTTSVREEGEGGKNKERRDEEMYGPGGGRLGIGGDVFGVSFDMPKGFIPGTMGVAGTAFNLATGKPISADATVNFKRGDVEFSVSGTDYNDLKSIIKDEPRGANSDRAIEKLKELQKKSYEKDVREKQQKIEQLEKESRKARQERMESYSPDKGFTEAQQRAIGKEAAQIQQEKDKESTSGYSKFADRDYVFGSGYKEEGDGGGASSSGTSKSDWSSDAPGGQASGTPWAVGGLASKPKPKKIKKMKKGGLASKK